ncbi:hypothetical protein [Leeia aquatica]|uniref:Uncharacterized protein n=1 Tax=Leeia aquatica TaxID=2725557 RepID=A0A847S2W7_9NEIS|nr:hypothetical protein [Leeia aquatica]NLR74133.1 hypothetical protein [Leeia aquatica]
MPDPAWEAVQKERWQAFAALHAVPDWLQRCAQAQFSDWQELYPGCWFETHNQDFIPEQLEVACLMYLTPPWQEPNDSEDWFEAQESIIVGVWLRDGATLTTGPVLAFGWASNHDDPDTSSPTGIYILAENLDGLQALLSSGALWCNVEDASGNNWQQTPDEAAGRAFAQRIDLAVADPATALERAHAAHRQWRDELEAVFEEE